MILYKHSIPIEGKTRGTGGLASRIRGKRGPWYSLGEESDLRARVRRWRG